MHKILFICTANRIRSPMAEYLFRRWLEDNQYNLSEWQVESAGTWANRNQPVMPLVLEAIAGTGLDVAAHRSRKVQKLALESYGLILTVEQGQREALCIEYPHLAERIQTITKLAYGLAYDVADPAGKPLPAYQSALRELTELIALAGPKIVARVALAV